MIALLDTNVLLDMIDRHRENYTKARCIWNVINNKQLNVVVTTQAIVDAAFIYTCRLKMPISLFKAYVDKLMAISTICDVTKKDIETANQSSIPDYEDAVQISCAKNYGCNMIISGDRDFHKYTDIPVYTVPELFSKIFEE